MTNFNFKVGDRVIWYDPDPIEGMEAQPGVINWIQVDPDDPEAVIGEDTLIALNLNDGGEAEVFPHELELEG